MTRRGHLRLVGPDDRPPTDRRTLEIDTAVGAMWQLIPTDHGVELHHESRSGDSWGYHGDQPTLLDALNEAHRIDPLAAPWGSP